MIATSEPESFFTRRHALYARFIAVMRYKQGLRAFFLKSGFLRPNLRILDAGCGTGALTCAVSEALARRSFAPSALHAFDLTPAMLEHFRADAAKRADMQMLELAQANVLDLDDLPPAWRGYDLVISAAMMEYLPRERLAQALANLRERLCSGGSLVLFMSRRNWLMEPLIGRWWSSNLYTQAELDTAFRLAEFSAFRFRHFPIGGAHLAPWAHIVEASR